MSGRGGPHAKRTLASFSLEGRVAVVTGGARGLGLVMSQALVNSGADVALVDLNSMPVVSYFTRTQTDVHSTTEEEAERSAGELVKTFQTENSDADRSFLPALSFRAQLIQK